MPEAAVRLVVGLGNPGERYAWTRHNAGFLALERLTRRLGASWTRAPVDPGRVAQIEWEGRTLRFGEPHTYMNESGSWVSALLRFYRIEPERALLVLDDLDLPLGRLRLRLSGSSGGQKGLGSVLERLQSPNIPRLRLGVGPRPPGADAARYVLSPFSREEEPLIEETLARAGDAILLACREGVPAAMNRYNAAPL